MNTLAETIIELTGSESSLVHVSYEDAFGKPFDDMMRRRPDTSKLQTLTGWSPKRSLRESLQEVIDFMRG